MRERSEQKPSASGRRSPAAVRVRANDGSAHTVCISSAGRSYLGAQQRPASSFVPRFNPKTKTNEMKLFLTKK